MWCGGRGLAAKGAWPGARPRPRPAVVRRPRARGGRARGWQRRRPREAILRGGRGAGKMNRSFNKSQTLRYLECSAVEVKSKVRAAAAAGTGAERSGAGGRHTTTSTAAARSFVSPPAPPALGVPGRSGKRPPRCLGEKPQMWPAGGGKGATAAFREPPRAAMGSCATSWERVFKRRVSSRCGEGWFGGLKGFRGQLVVRGHVGGILPVGASCPGGAGDPTATSSRTGGLGASLWTWQQIGWTWRNEQGK